VERARLRTHARVALRRLGYDLDHYRFDQAEETIMKALRAYGRGLLARARSVT
jgi:hypothetical protein